MVSWWNFHPSILIVKPRSHFNTKFKIWAKFQQNTANISGHVTWVKFRHRGCTRPFFHKLEKKFCQYLAKRLRNRVLPFSRILKITLGQKISRLSSLFAAVIRLCPSRPIWVESILSKILWRGTYESKLSYWGIKDVRVHPVFQRLIRHCLFCLTLLNSWGLLTLIYINFHVEENILFNLWACQSWTNWFRFSNYRFCSKLQIVILR